METKSILKRVLPVALAFVIVLLLALLYTVLSQNAKNPTLTNPNDAYGKVGTVSITNDEVYSRLLRQNGASVLEDEMTNLLTSKFVSAAKTDDRFDIDEAYERAIYNGSTLEEAKNLYGEVELEAFLNRFNDNLILNNFTEATFKEELYKDYAKTLYLEDYLRTQAATNSYYIVDAVADYYEDHFFSDGDFITLRFNTVKEAVNTFNTVGVTPHSDGVLYKNFYINDELISEDSEDYPTDPDELKKLELTDEEALQAYIQVYNLMNKNKEEIVILDDEVLNTEKITYEDAQDVSQTYANFLFKTLNTDDNKYQDYPVSLTVSNQGDTEKKAFVMAYKLAGDNKKSFKDTFTTGLDDDAYKKEVDQDASKYTPSKEAALYREVYNEMIESDATGTTLQNTTIRKAIRDDLKLTIYDRRLNQLYVAIDSNFKNLQESGDVLYSYELNGETVNVTPNDFLKVLEKNYAANVFNTLANEKVYLSDQALFDKNITDEVRLLIRNNLANFKVNYQGGAYTQFGFSPLTTEWPDFLYGVLGVESETAYHNQQVVRFMSSAYLLKNFRENQLDSRYQDMVDYYNNAYSLDTNHVLVFVDRDFDTNPDRLVSEEDDALASELAKMIQERLTSTEDLKVDLLQTIVTEYNDAAINDETYGKYKEAGIKLLTEEVKDVTQESQLDDAYLASSKKLYETLTADEDLKFSISEPTKSSFGYHIIYGTSADNKLDAYPADNNLVFPTKEDVEKYYETRGQDEENASINSFIETYYTVPLDEDVAKEGPVFLDEQKAKMGVTLNNSDVKAQLDRITRLNLEIKSRDN